MSRREKLDLIRLGETLAAELDRAADLWTWLPSFTVAKTHHDDHALNFVPPVADVMTEAAMYFAHSKRPEEPLTDEEREWFGRCPCGNYCEEQQGGI